jgi:hypothetical protein
MARLTKAEMRHRPIAPQCRKAAAVGKNAADRRNLAHAV